MYVVKKRLQRAKQQFKRENDFGFPYNRSAVEPQQRKEFLGALLNNKEFDKTEKQNHEKFKDSVFAILKKFNGFDCFCVAMFGLGTGCFTYVAAAEKVPNSKIIKQYQDAAIVLFTAIGLLAGLGLGIGNQVSLKRIEEDVDSCNLYSRLSVRLFDLMHEENPDLDENMLKACNPEMAEVIRALMVANMTDDDVREIQSVAQNIAKLLHEVSPADKDYVMLQLDREMKNVMAIVKQNLSINQQLYDAILGVYRGNIPARFVLQKQQKTL